MSDVVESNLNPVSAPIAVIPVLETTDKAETAVSKLFTHALDDRISTYGGSWNVSLLFCFGAYLLSIRNWRLNQPEL